MSDNTPTPDGAETTIHDAEESDENDDSSWRPDWVNDGDGSDREEANIDDEVVQTQQPPTDREPKRVELDLPDELGVYDSIRHRNGDETFLLLSEFGDGYQALAFDINAGGEILETEIVGHAETDDRAVGVCEFWLQANPDGVLGASENPNAGSSDGGSVLDNLKSMFGGDQ